MRSINLIIDELAQAAVEQEYDELEVTEMVGLAITEAYLDSLDAIVGD